MGEDEEATLRTLSAYRKIIDQFFENHRGRFVNSAGDSVLAEFTSVVEPVSCAVEIQDTVKVENENLPPERRIPLWDAAARSSNTLPSLPSIAVLPFTNSLGPRRHIGAGIPNLMHNFKYRARIRQ